eukprot:TRINITY_DN61374_c0_g1_i1.p2 TRINITY_DN61374_c0_g1~~TRINITY_DN61374_c0_g1_i1.p2  ORF type:complete len:166 (+),score=45.25 TRINITY_DN61374_c0_g1_i1:57-554(+)
MLRRVGFLGFAFFVLAVPTAAANEGDEALDAKMDVITDEMRGEFDAFTDDTGDALDGTTRADRAYAAEQMFEAGDHNNDGQLSLEEIVNLAKADDAEIDFDQDTLDTMRSDLDTFDTDENGELSKAEFLDMMDDTSADEEEESGAEADEDEHDEHDSPDPEFTPE